MGMTPIDAEGVEYGELLGAGECDPALTLSAIVLAMVHLEGQRTRAQIARFFWGHPSATPGFASTRAPLPDEEGREVVE